MKPRVIAIIQGRMGSSRLPGKILLDLAGKPMLARRKLPGRQVPIAAPAEALRDAPPDGRTRGFETASLVFAGERAVVIGRPRPVPRLPRKAKEA